MYGLLARLHMPFDYAALGRRMQAARMHLQVRRGENVSLAEIGDLVAAAYGQPGREFTAGQIRDYTVGKIRPPLDVVAAYAEATGVDAGWLAFGGASGGEVPTIPAEPPRPGMPGLERPTARGARSRREG